MSKLRNTFVEAARQHKNISKERIISEICLEHGAAKRTALEYINVLIASGFVEADKDNLCLSNKKQVLKDIKQANKILKEAKL